MIDERRRLPSVDALVRRSDLGALVNLYSRQAVTSLAREVIADARAGVGGAPAEESLAEEVVRRAQQRWRPGPVRVINATGVILHTNLGRAPLSVDAAAAAAAVMSGYSALELDLDTGRRGSRHDHMAGLLQHVTGAEDGIVVNNAAAALILTLAALCRRRDVIVSRGQAVEIGGGFRIPDIMRESGARLVEVGTTNRTRLSDYADAISDGSAALLRVHASNFRIVGFAEQVEIGALGRLAHERGIPLLDDVGSGALIDPRPFGLIGEPLVQDSVAAGAGVVIFSGDKLLGGPQAGIIVGRADLIVRLRRHPLMRVLRPDKGTIAALGATLLHYVRGDALQAIPVWRMITTRPDNLEARARRWADRLVHQDGVVASVCAVESTVGGGSLPGEMLPSYALTIAPRSRTDARASAIARALREADIPVIARIDNDCVALDARTVLPDEDDQLLSSVMNALERTVGP